MRASGVRSSCETLATSSRRCWSTRASSAAILLKACASSPTSSREVALTRRHGLASALGRAKGSVAALVGGQTSNEEGHLVAHLVREVLGASDVESRAAGGPSAELATALGHPDLSATVADIEFAHTVLVIGAEPVDDMPIVDLRIRKGVRRNHVKLAVARIALSPLV